MTTSKRTGNHTMQSTQGTSWRSGDPPPCLGGTSHWWVPVNTHSTQYTGAITTGGCGWLGTNHKHSTGFLMLRIQANFSFFFFTVFFFFCFLFSFFCFLFSFLSFLFLFSFFFFPFLFLFLGCSQSDFSDLNCLTISHNNSLTVSSCETFLTVMVVCHTYKG